MNPVRKITALVVAAAGIFTFPTTVAFANEQPSEQPTISVNDETVSETTSEDTAESESFSFPDLPEDFTADFFDTENWGKPNTQENYQTFLKSIDKLVDSTSGELIFSNAAQMDNSSLVNVQYSLLVEQMNRAGFGKTGELKIPEFKTGYSKDIMTVFQDTYGKSYEDFALKESGIPKDFNVSEMMKQSSQARADAVKEFKSGEAYKQTLDSISIGDCFDTASNPLQIPELESSQSMKQRLSEFTNGLAEKYSKDNAYNSQEMMDIYEDLRDNNQKWFETRTFDHGGAGKGF